MRRNSLSLGLTTALFALAALPMHALAQPRQETAPRFGALRTRTETGLEVRRERVELSCDLAGEASLDCDVTVTITIANPASEPFTAPVSITTERIAPFTMTGEDGSEGEAPTVRPFDAVIPGSGERAIVLHGHLDLAPPHQSGGIGGTVDGLTARHPLLATAIHHEIRRLLYTRPVRRDFATLGSVELRARLPVGWTLRTSDPRFVATDEGGEQVLVRELDDPRSPADVEITVEEGTGPDPVRHGGPYLAIGAEIDPANGPWSFRGRVGYEAGILDYLVLGLSIETNFRDAANLAVLIEATTWSMVVPPALSAGLGAVFQLLESGPTSASHRNAGIRLAAGATIYSVGFDATFDVFPSDGHWEITLAGRAGL